jgi:hypothetical protein
VSCVMGVTSSIEVKNKSKSDNGMGLSQIRQGSVDLCGLKFVQARGGLIAARGL